MSLNRTILRFPDLPGPYDEALRQAIDYLDERFDIAAVAACGSIVRGAPDANSDLDVYVINRQPFRMRVQRFFSGVPAEIFVNPEFQVRAYLSQEQRAARPLTAHMLATGFVMYDPDATMAALRREASALLDEPPAPLPNPTLSRYMIAAIYEDAMDVIDRDPHTAGLYLHEALWQTLTYIFRAQPAFVPRTKDLLQTLRNTRPELHELVEDAMDAPDTRTSAELIGRLLDAVIGARGFFEWETEPEALTPETDKQRI